MLLSETGASSEAANLKKELEELQLKLEIERSLLAAVGDWKKSWNFEARAGEFDAQLRKLFPNVGIVLNMVDNKREKLVCEWIKLPKQHSIDEDEFYKAQTPFHILDANVECFRKCTKLSLNHGNILRYPGTTQKRFERWGMKELLIFPIFAHANKNTIGTCMVFSDSGRFSQEERRFIHDMIESYSGQFYLSWFRAHRKEQEEFINRIEQEQSKFSDFINKASDLHSVEDIYALTLDEMMRRHPFDICALLMEEHGQLKVKSMRIDPESEALERVTAFGEHYELQGYDLNPKDGVTSYCYMTNRLIFYPDVAELMDRPMSAKDREGLSTLNGARTFVFLPVRNGSQAIGVLWMISATQVVKISDEDLQITQMIASYVGSSLSNAALYEKSVEQAEKIGELNAKLNSRVDELRMLATTDNLTGLNNFAYFQNELSRRISETERASPNKNLAVVIADVDHFKSFNDRFGHLVGNEVLKEIAKRLVDVGREMDIPCRYGGEEFVVILPRCDIEGAEKFAERVRRAVEMIPFEVEGNSVSITISCGCARYVKGELMSELIKRADDALYQAKREGRNRVIVAQ